MNQIKNRLQLIILESPYSSWEDPLVGDLFAKMVALKKSGYSSNYPNPVLPVDTTDFIATHVLLCLKESQNEFLPIMGYKTTSIDVCKKNNLVFPGLGLVRAAHATKHCQAVERIIENCENKNRGLAYLGSWTVDQNFKSKNPEFKDDLRQIFSFVYNSVYEMQKISEVIIGGTLRFKTEKVFHELGHRPLELGDESLPLINVTHLAGENVLVMHSKQFVPTNPFIAKKWRSLWENRLEIGTENQFGTKKSRVNE